MKKISVTLIALGAAVTLAACQTSTDAGGRQIIIIDTGIQMLRVADASGNDTVSITPNHTVQLVATALNSQLVPVLPVTWKTVWWSGDSSVALVDSTGLVSGVSGGNAWIFGMIQPDSNNAPFRDSALVKVLVPN